MAEQPPPAAQNAEPQTAPAHFPAPNVEPVIRASHVPYALTEVEWYQLKNPQSLWGAAGAGFFIAAVTLAVSVVIEHQLAGAALWSGQMRTAIGLLVVGGVCWGISQLWPGDRGRVIRRVDHHFSHNAARRIERE